MLRGRVVPWSCAGYSVDIADTLVEGGVFRTASGTISYHDPAKLVIYYLSSDPAGLQSQSAMVPTGTILTTPNLYGATQGYTFAYWTVDGVRQSGPSGIAQTRLQVALNRDYMQIVAHYVPTAQDSDADGVADWFEQFYFGTLDYSGTGDPDSDTWSVNTEQARGYNAAIADTVVEGGTCGSMYRVNVALPSDYRPSGP